MRFAHIADCHIGSWREPQLANLSTIAFGKAIDNIIEKRVDFVIIAGDLFNTSLPSVDNLKDVVKKLKELKDKEIPVYIVAGSHDFSPSGKTMLDVLEEAGLVINVAKGEIVEDKLRLLFTIDKKTGVKLTGLLGKKGGLDKNYYENLIRENLESEPGYKIFIFHALLSELKPKGLEEVDSHPLSLLPKNFNYYAGGHPHFVCAENMKDYGIVAYPGPLFPNNFKELEELKNGGYYLVEDNVPEWIPIKVYDVESLSFNAEHKVPETLESEIRSDIEKRELKDKIVTLRISGTLENGKPSDIHFHDIFSLIKEKGAYAILKNSAALSSKEFEEVKVELSDTEEIEKKLISEHIKKDDLDKDAIDLAHSLLKVLDTGKKEGETQSTFEKRVIEELNKVID